MSKYNEKVVYSGNLMKYTNGQSILLRKGIYLVYEPKTNTFYSLNDTLNYFLDLDLNNNLTEQQREEYKKIIQKHNYPYFSSGIPEEIYIDENSIEVVMDNNKMNR